MPALDSVSQMNIKKYFRIAETISMFEYMLGHAAGIEVEDLIKNYSKELISEFLTLTEQTYIVI